MTITKNLFDFPESITKKAGEGSTIFNMDFNDTYTISFDVYCPNSDYYGSAACCEIFCNGKEIDILLPLESQYGYVRKYVTVTGNLTRIIFTSYGTNLYTSYKDIQLEEGSIATPYVPYGYLPMYKGRYKVSNVCQLLDKSTYPATKTVNGVTFTNNGDGSYTANGTPSGLGFLYIASLSNLIVGHKYYSPSSEYSNGIYIETKIDRKNADTIWVSNQIREWEENDTMMYITLIANPNFAPTVENAKLIPQLFDLTEMFGAGNEPTTVEEFKEKFPDDLYPYSPYCWAKIKSLIYKDNIDYIKMK